MAYSAVALFACSAGLFLAAMARTGWGAGQIGSAASWFAAATTIAAVVVALRGGLRAERAALDAIQTADERAEEERKYGHRRETTKAVAELWASIVAAAEPLDAFLAATATLPTVQEFMKPGKSAADEAKSRVLEALNNVEVRLFYLEAIAIEPNLIAELRTINHQTSSLYSKVSESGPRQDGTEHAAAIRAGYGAILGRRHELVKVVRTHLPPLRAVEDELNRHSEWLKQNGGDFFAA
ncbi:hypothetical protein O4215_10855 [Rhodococcus maanshanensis]|uniref:hypothetical protein n=1 Tax=Rhodococcus maanshanensis TaxID=183556 RepID=UPI0022B3D88D|nr:hypothetical protein [Rhodococcus maanshanensis]MCZ4556076.1 hypothetical protein [Rhodococcus maanshanensis]